MGSLDLIRVDFDLIATAVPGSKIRTLAASACTRSRQVNSNLSRPLPFAPAANTRPLRSLSFQ